MPVFECCICWESLKNSENVLSTSCGHIFHKSCLDKCRQSLDYFSCPQCRHPNPTSHKIFLNFEDSKENEHVETLQKELSKAKLEVKEMQKIIAEEKCSPNELSQTKINFKEPKGTQTVIIRGVCKNDIKNPLYETILMLTDLMELPCGEADVESAYILDQKVLLKTQNKSDKLSIVVKFRSLEMKDRFLNNENKLISKGITLTEYVDQYTNELLEYANSLCTRGFKNIFFRCNSIFAQKQDDEILHQIRSKEDVDNISA